MESQQVESSASEPATSPPNPQNTVPLNTAPQNTAPTRQEAFVRETPSLFSTSGISSWAKSLKIPQPSNQEDSESGNAGKSTFARFTSGFGLRLSPKSGQQDESVDVTATSPRPGVLGSFTKGIVDSSRSAVKAVQVKARHIVSQNKRRYQEGGFDLDMTYITENIIAMGFPAGDMSSGFFGYIEGFYRNHMEEVIKYFETHHKGKYKVYNLCSERLYDASLFEGKVACFPFDDHNCPPIQLIISFCQSAYSWLKEDIENVVVVHCKAGMARTGLMISSLLLYLKFFPTAEESIEYYNQKRCVDGKGLVLPSQIRYVKYYERILTYFNGENQPGRRCMLRGFRLHKCPYWIRPSITISNHNGILFSTKKHPRTKDLMPEDFWFSAPKKGIMVFALPGEPGLTEVAGDFKIHFHDRQGDFYCWLNTTMTENRKILSASDLDGFEKRKLPSPGFQVEVVLVDYDGSQPSRPVNTTSGTNKEPVATENNNSSSSAPSNSNPSPNPNPTTKETGSSQQDRDDVFSDSEETAEGGGSTKSRRVVSTTTAAKASETSVKEKEAANVAQGIEKVSLKSEEGEVRTEGGESKKASPPSGSGPPPPPQPESTSSVSEFKAMAADASVFSFGDDEDYESE
ncbi:phosphatidylinositol 3,4,5-trisphosphate 3-phosphatase and protein-tyrosine-phosphatase PTEN2A-like [Ananas comosus]|uniref:Phosphatidylinositol 3,4,5-trisphosphate 3-phosphatase and protein-tyrosine-phosphatase PTEN2A-like n=1 Tax=Ananas comosus TaxID=4615 RepID=A0A6P5EAL4_ANACO|nr:phosphatidylinositol 3,4,5-trisphosphate 3-phosphatase and protein-tyrosine-phosphatase PTEN2A-like [Ananas comosus]XP_020080241.1 phosphatidylinositol 3,4,5-trisphosphate 3-phosphatase and protein-tyrosine-phosphatase PTEN2A-like [Ananas comosus]